MRESCFVAQGCERHSNERFETAVREKSRVEVCTSYHPHILSVANE